MQNFVQVLQTFSSTFGIVRAPSFNQRTTMLRTGNYLHHQSHADWYSIMCADDMHKTLIIFITFSPCKGLDYTLCKVVGWLESRCWKVHKVSVRLGHALLLVLNRNIKFKLKHTWKFFSSLSSLYFSHKISIMPSYHLYNPCSPGASYAVGCPVVSRDTHTHMHTHSWGSGAIFGSCSAATNKEK